MDSIFHERQEGSLCAQHALNALLQGNYFTAIDLAELARQLDESERARMAEGGETEEFHRFVQQPSSNFDDSGYFSIQVIQRALSVWGLELTPYQSSDPVAVSARQNPINQSAYICNFKDHWFSVRKLGHQWFNLNSLLTGPELISDTYLSMFLTQLQQEGYSIFLVLGHFPDCEADELLKLMPAVQKIKPKLLTEVTTSTSTGDEGINQEDLQKALEESKRLIEDDDGSLQAALALSLQGIDASSISAGPSSHCECATSNPTPSTSQKPDLIPDKVPDAEEIRKKRLAYLDKSQKKEPDPPVENGEKLPSELTEDEMLQAALKMSMESSWNCNEFPPCA